MQLLKSIQIFCILTSMHCVAQDNVANYFGLTEPATSAQVFNPSILNFKNAFLFNAIYNTPNCNAFYFTKVDTKENIYVTSKQGDTWSAPKIAAFSNTAYHDADPYLINNGKRLYFVSSRPTHRNDTNHDYNIWYTDKTEDGWSNPAVLPEPINTNYDEFFFSMSNKGHVFFASNRPGGKGSYDIYTTKMNTPNTFSKPINIGAPINTKYFEYDPYIAPDESFMIFSIDDHPNTLGKSDIYFSYKDTTGNWSTPINMGNKVNTTRTDFAPSITPDNKYIMFTSGGQLKWISVDILDYLKKSIPSKKHASKK